MELTHWLLFTSVITLASISPGPNVLAVIVQALEAGTKGALYTIIGNLIALFTIALAAAVGVGALLEAAPSVFTLMKVAGGLYLVWMGIKLLRHSFTKQPRLQVLEASEPLQPASMFTLIFRAMLISYSNPKSILFLSAVFPAFLNQSVALPQQFIVMFVTVIGVVSIVHGAYGFFALRMKRHLMKSQARKLIARLSGFSFLGFGCGFLYDAQK